VLEHAPILASPQEESRKNPYGRNVWQREWGQAQEIIEQIKEIMLSSVRRIP
jgi:hypothetical protein